MEKGFLQTLFDKTLGKFKGPSSSHTKEPTAQSDVIGLELTIEKKEGALPIKSSPDVSYLAEDHYYEVTVKSNGNSDQYPANENIRTFKYVRLLPESDQAYVSVSETPKSSIEAIPADTGFKGFRLIDPSDTFHKKSTFQVTADLELSDWDKKMGITAHSQGQNFPKKLAQKPAKKHPAPRQV